MGEPIEKHSWNRELEFGLPDSRLTVDRAKGQMQGMTPHGRMWMDRAFCMNCGRDGGLVTPECVQFFSYLCEECAYRWGTPPGMAEVPGPR
jgi:hypothetical protein